MRVLLRCCVRYTERSSGRGAGPVVVGRRRGRNVRSTERCRRRGWPRRPAGAASASESFGPTEQSGTQQVDGGSRRAASGAERSADRTIRPPGHSRGRIGRLVDHLGAEDGAVGRRRALRRGSVDLSTIWGPRTATAGSAGASRSDRSTCRPPGGRGRRASRRRATRPARVATSCGRARLRETCWAWAWGSSWGSAGVWRRDPWRWGRAGWVA